MRWLQISAVVGALGVAFGAFGAHALKSRLPPELLSVYHTATLYHLLHAVALFALVLFGRSTNLRIAWPASLFLGGILLFSGSLYLLAVTGYRQLGMITPLGGLCLIAAWISSGWLLSRSYS